MQSAEQVVPSHLLDVRDPPLDAMIKDTLHSLEAYAGLDSMNQVVSKSTLFE